MNTATLRYCWPSAVKPITVQGRPALSLPQGGCVIVDRVVLRIWEQAHQRTFEELLAAAPQLPAVDELGMRAILACLAESGLLERAGDSLHSSPASPPEGLRSAPLVSVILVSHNSRAWLSGCLSSLLSQTYPDLEILIVDNASQDDTCEWVNNQAAKTGAERPLRLIQIEQQVSLAAALNRGAECARGKYWLFLNPDTQLEPEVITELVRAADAADCAAVAAKLCLSAAPAFLNGLGNSVGPFSWGTDLGLGHLDLGQWEHWTELPSACFAAALINPQAWEAVGPLDEGFPMYYEDSEWCYRARLAGYRILAAPRAVVYHAFSGQLIAAPEERTIQPAALARKLRHVTYGRLRWAGLILGPATRLRFWISYAGQDLLRTLAAIFSGRWASVAALLHGWGDFLRAWPAIRLRRRTIQARRTLSDRELLTLQRRAPLPLVWQGHPLLTWDVICREYLPLMVAGLGRPTPEFPEAIRQQAAAALSRVSSPFNRMACQPFWARLKHLWQNEGAAATIHRLGREIQHRLSIM